MISTASTAVGLGLVAAVLLGPAPSNIDAERDACRQQCAASEPAGTDRTTCELVCDTRANNRKGGPTVTRWKTEKEVGGPPPGVAAGTRSNARTTTTVTDRSGTSTGSQGTVGQPAPAATTAVRGRTGFVRRAALASCQTKCDFAGSDALRWACKIGCLRDHPTDGSATHVPTGVSLGAEASGPRRRPTGTAGPSSAKPQGGRPASATADVCASECADSSGDDRSTCVAQCRNRTTQTRTEYKGTRAVGSGTAKAGVSACRTTCAAAATACRDACTGADASTCRLQCDQAASSCQRRCG